MTIAPELRSIKRDAQRGAGRPGRENSGKREKGAEQRKLRAVRQAGERRADRAGAEHQHRDVA